MERYSKQRELILSSLKQRTDHPTAEKLYMDLKSEMPDLGIATVYRNLSVLCESGDISKIKLGQGSDRYDGKIEPHIHFMCSKCSEIIDIELNDELMQSIDNDINMKLEKLEAKIEVCSINTFGRCSNCK